MPVAGLPTALEFLLKGLLANGELASWDSHGSENGVVVTLKFNSQPELPESAADANGTDSQPSKTKSKNSNNNNQELSKPKSSEGSGKEQQTGQKTGQNPSRKQSQQQSQSKSDHKKQNQQQQHQQQHGNHRQKNEHQGHKGGHHQHHGQQHPNHGSPNQSMSDSHHHHHQKMHHQNAQQMSMSMGGMGLAMHPFSGLMSPPFMGRGQPLPGFGPGHNFPVGSVPTQVFSKSKKQHQGQRPQEQHRKNDPKRDHHQQQQGASGGGEGGNHNNRPNSGSGNKNKNKHQQGQQSKQNKNKKQNKPKQQQQEQSKSDESKDDSGSTEAQDGLVDLALPALERTVNSSTESPRSGGKSATLKSQDWSEQVEDISPADVGISFPKTVDEPPPNPRKAEEDLKPESQEIHGGKNPVEEYEVGRSSREKNSSAEFEYEEPHPIVEDI